MWHENWITNETEDVRQDGEEVTYGECRSGAAVLRFHDQDEWPSEPAYAVETVMYGTDGRVYEHSDTVTGSVAQQIVMNYGGWDYVE